MSLSSIIGAVASTVHQAADAAESAALTAIAPVAQAVGEAVAPVAVDVLRQVATNPQWFGREASGIAALLTEAYDGEPIPPLLPPEPLRSMVSTAAQA